MDKMAIIGKMGGRDCNVELPLGSKPGSIEAEGEKNGIPGVYELPLPPEFKEYKRIKNPNLYLRFEGEVKEGKYYISSAYSVPEFFEVSSLERYYYAQRVICDMRYEVNGAVSIVCCPEMILVNEFSSNSKLQKYRDEFISRGYSDIEVFRV